MKTSDMIRMANQIATFFKAYEHDVAVKEIADHINRFWEPRMRQAFFDYMATGGAGLDDLLQDAAKLVRRPNIKPATVDEPKDAHTGLPHEAHEA